MDIQKTESLMTVATQIQDSQASLPDQLLIKSTTSSKTPLEEKYKFNRANLQTAVKIVKMPLKEKVKPKTVIKKRYFTAGCGIDETNKKDLEKQPSPFAYPKDLANFAYKVLTTACKNDVRIKELKGKCSQKPSHKDRQTKDLLQRLYVEEPTIDSMKSILDIAPEYYKVVEGRPIPERLNTKKYIDIIRDNLRKKIVNGYREDDIMLIEENLLLEQKVIESIRENYDKYVNTFEEFLYRDHTSAMQLLKDSEKAAMEAYEKYQEYKTVAKKYASIRSSLYNSEEKWRNCKIYEKFLFLVSPYSWRSQRQHSGSIATSFGLDVEETLFGIGKSLSETEINLSDLIVKFNKEYQEDIPVELYFTDPEQLLDVFKFMEMQNLNSLLHSEELALSLEQIKDGITQAEEMFDKEIQNLEEIVDKLEGGIKWEEERAKYLEDLALKLIGNEFKELVISEEVLNLHVFVEEVYETRIGPNDANLSMADMMKAIEARYRQELLALDKVPADQVALLETGCYAEQMMVMRLAEKAAKQYMELERLTHKLNLAFAPPFKKAEGKEVKYRSKPPGQRKKPVTPPRKLTSIEAEYLDYFTDYCKFSDDPKDYDINTVLQDKHTEKSTPDIDK